MKPGNILIKISQGDNGAGGQLWISSMNSRVRPGVIFFPVTISKGIEYAIELVKELQNPRCKLVISHEGGDEGFEYPDWIKEHAGKQGVDLRLVRTRISDPWVAHGNSQNQYSLWDIYPHADFITYPSLIEGFGNALLEAIYFKKPLLINRYDTFARDIEPHGFDLIVMDGFLTNKTFQAVGAILESVERKEKMVSCNYEIAARHYSYSVLRKHLNAIMINFFGEYVPPHLQKVISYFYQTSDERCVRTIGIKPEPN